MRYIGRYFAIGLFALMAVVLVVTSATTVYSALTGAIYTTECDLSTGDCTGVDINLYEDKEDVYLDGGPRGRGDGTQLPDGEYYVQVTDPSGSTVLGSSVHNADVGEGEASATPIVVDGGSFETCYKLWDIVAQPQGNGGNYRRGYADTPNNGGVYKVWISQTDDFLGSSTKTDNFKVRHNREAQPALLEIVKFYDVNRNGQWDSGEPEIVGWRAHVEYPEGFEALDQDVFTPWSEAVPAPKRDSYSYTVYEIMPSGGCWMATTDDSFTLDVEEGGTYRIEFGNVCLVPLGVTMHTKGFWHNKEGSEIAAAYLAGLRDLCLVDGDGYDFDPYESSFDEGEHFADNPDDLSPWLIDGGSGDDDHTRENFAQQLAAFYLNVVHYLEGGDDTYLVYDGDFLSMAALLEMADDALCAGYDADLHALLDALNNGNVTIYGFSATVQDFEY